MRNTTVIKLGGSLLENHAMRNEAIAAIAAARRRGDRIITIHGGGKSIDRNLASRGISPSFHEGLRITDDATIEVVVDTLTSEVRRMLVGELASRHVAAIGLSGLDDRLLIASRRSGGAVAYGHVGDVRSVRADLLEALLVAGRMPLIASVAVSEEGFPLNVNADSVASAIAVATGASRLVFLTDVEGVRDRSGAVVDMLDPRAIDELLASPAVTGGMRPKLIATREAVIRGVGQVVIAGPSRHQSAVDRSKGGTLIAAA
jgi:acetylglutamate kinase